MAERIRGEFQNFRANPGAYLREKERDIYQHFQEFVLERAPVVYAPGFNELLKQYPNGLPEYLAVHKGHAAGVTDAEVAYQTRPVINEALPPDKQIIGSLLIVADTLQDTQPEEVVGYWHRAQPILKKLDVEILPVRRAKDTIPDEASRIKQEESMRTQNTVLSQKIAEGRSPILLVEGTVQSGRQKEGGKPGEINGMVEVFPRSISWISAPVRRLKREPIFIPIGTTGENRVYDPQTKKVPFSTKATAVFRSLPGGEQRIPHIMSAVVGYPVSYTEIVAKLEEVTDDKKQIPELLDRYIGEVLAQLVPPHERGVYAEPILLPHINLPYFTYEEAKAA